MLFIHRDVFCTKYWVEPAVFGAVVESDKLCKTFWSVQEWWQQCSQVPYQKHVWSWSESARGDYKNAMPLQLQLVETFFEKLPSPSYHDQICLARSAPFPILHALWKSHGVHCSIAFFHYIVWNHLLPIMDGYYGNTKSVDMRSMWVDSRHVS